MHLPLLQPKLKTGLPVKVLCTLFHSYLSIGWPAPNTYFVWVNPLNQNLPYLHPFYCDESAAPRLSHCSGCCQTQEWGLLSPSDPWQRPINDVTHNRTCEDLLCNPKTTEVCFSVSHPRWDSWDLMQSLSRIDYCNVVFAGLPQHSIIRLQ